MNKTTGRARSIRLGIVVSATALIATAAGVALAGPASADITCPATGYVCAYMNNGFSSNQYYTKGKINFSGAVIDGQMSSVRNRTGCTVRLYDGYNYQGDYISVAPRTEVSQIGTVYGSYWNDRIHSVKFATSTGDC
jgi:hypothetical protein